MSFCVLLVYSILGNFPEMFWIFPDISWKNPEYVLEISWKLPGIVLEKSGNFPENPGIVPEMSWKCRGKMLFCFAEMFWKCPGNFPAGKIMIVMAIRLLPSRALHSLTGKF